MYKVGVTAPEEAHAPVFNAYMYYTYT